MILKNAEIAVKMNATSKPMKISVAMSSVGREEESHIPRVINSNIKVKIVKPPKMTIKTTIRALIIKEKRETKKPERAPRPGPEAIIPAIKPPINQATIDNGMNNHKESKVVPRNIAKMRRPTLIIEPTKAPKKIKPALAIDYQLLI